MKGPGSSGPPPRSPSGLHLGLAAILMAAGLSSDAPLPRFHEPLVDDRRSDTRTWLAALPESARTALVEADELSRLIERLSLEGLHREALLLAEKQLGMRRRHLTGDHPDVARSLVKVGDELSALADRTAAVKAQEDALAMRRRLFGEAHPEIAESLARLGMARKGLLRWDEGIVLLEQALRMRTALHGEVHPAVADALIDLGNVHRSRGHMRSSPPDLDIARSCFERALAIRRRCRPPGDPAIAQALSQIAFLDLSDGDFRAAEKRARQAVAIHRRSGADSRESLVFTLNIVGAACGRLGAHGKSEMAFLESAIIHEDLRRKANPDLLRPVDDLSAYSHLALAQINQGKTVEAWQSMERGLARRLLDAMIPLPPDVQAGGHGTPVTTGSVATPVRNLPPDPRFLSLDRVQAVLPERAALIGWLESQILGQGVIYPVWGYVIRRNRPIEWVPIDQPPGLSPLHQRRGAMMAVVRAAASSPFRVGDTPELDRLEQDLYEERMAPLLPCLDGIEDLIVVTPSPYVGMPLEALMDRSGSYVADRFNVTYVPSTTIYAWNRRRTGAGSRPGEWRALLVGDPVFDPLAIEEEGVAPADLLAASDPGISGWSGSGQEVETQLVRSVLSGDHLALARLPRLPRTRQEIGHLAVLLPKSHVLLGRMASEERIGELVKDTGAPFQLIHFASHAFIHPQDPGRSAILLSHPACGASSRFMESAADSPDSAAHDGLLTAREIADTWRIEASLVTLSACQTALGPSTYFEGSTGLVQPLLKAGARTVLASLWNVDDRSTALLMNSFYAGLTGSTEGSPVRVPMTKSAALSEAKRRLRGYQDDRGNRPFAHPVYWAGFVLVGDSE